MSLPPFGIRYILLYRCIYIYLNKCIKSNQISLSLCIIQAWVQALSHINMRPSVQVQHMYSYLCAGVQILFTVVSLMLVAFAVRATALEKSHDGLLLAFSSKK